MSDQNEEINNEEDPVNNFLSYKTVVYMVLFLLVVLIVGFVISFINFQLAVNKHDHVRYFWAELNIPKGYPDSVYVEQIIYKDTSRIIVPDTVKHDTVVTSKPVAVAPPPAAAPVRERARTAEVVRQNTPPPPKHIEYNPHCSDEDKNAILYQIEALKKANNITSNAVELAHVYHSNGMIFMKELEDFLRSKGYAPDDGNGSRMIFGSSNNSGWSVSLKPDSKIIIVNIGMF
jgi:hypothetical protein